MMNSLFGNNVVNTHENKANSNFQQNSSAPIDYEEEYTGNSNASGSNSPNSSAEPLDFDSVQSFKDIEYKDGRIDSGDDEEWIERKKCTMAEIAGKPIIIRSVHERTSKMYDGSKYISINFVNEQGEECFCNTSGLTIKKQLEEKNMQYPFKTVVKACPKKDNPNMKYYKLS